jgi:hypothetical protein
LRTGEVGVVYEVWLVGGIPAAFGDAAEVVAASSDRY